MPSEDISFYASISRNPKYPTHYGTLKFEKGALLNIGGHFNHTTGYFKSPKKGIYHFSYEMTFFDMKGNETRVHFYMNDIPVVNGFSIISESSRKNKIVNQVTLELYEGDTICLKAINKDNSEYVSTNLHFYQSISGYLLKATPFKENL